MKRFKAYEPEQGYLLPPSPKDWLPEGHLAHFIDQVVDELDLGAIYASYTEDGGQPPPYHPRMMVKVWLYAFARGIRSSRKLERALWRLDCAVHNLPKLWRAGVSWEPRWATA